MVLDQQVSVNCNVSAEVSGVTVQTVCKTLMWIYYLIREEAIKKDRILGQYKFEIDAEPTSTDYYKPYKNVLPVANIYKIILSKL